MQKPHPQDVAIKVFVKIKDITFDRRLGVVFKRRPYADVRNTFSPGAVDQGRRCIDTKAWNDTVVWLQIRGWKTYRVAPSVSANNHAFTTVRTPEHPTREIDPPFR